MDRNNNIYNIRITICDYYFPVFVWNLCEHRCVARGKICRYPVGDDVLGGPLCTTKTKAQPFRLRFHPLFFIFIRAINIFKSIFATLYHQIVKRDLLGLRQYFHFPHQFQGHSKCFVNVFLLFHRKWGHAYSPFPVWILHYFCANLYTLFLHHYFRCKLHLTQEMASAIM